MTRIKIEGMNPQYLPAIELSPYNWCCAWARNSICSSLCAFKIGLGVMVSGLTLFNLQ